MSGRSPNYLRAAFFMPANLFALVAGGVASVVLGEWTPLIAASGGSVAYLTLLSALPSFRRAVRANFEAQSFGEIASGEELERLLRELAPPQREHYDTLAALKGAILERYQTVPGGRVLAASSERKLEALLTSFLRMVSTLNTYRRFLNSSDRRAIEAEVEQLEAELRGEERAELRDVKQRRVEILKKRVARFVHADERREVLSHQLATIEDVLRLTHEQAISLRDAESVTRQLESLTAEVDATEETVREMDKFMQVTDELSSATAAAEPVRVR